MNKNQNKEIIRVIEKGLLDKKISRLDLLKLARIDYCLECWGYGYDERTAEGYCFPCEKQGDNGNQKPAKKTTPLPFDLAAKEFFKKLAKNEN